MPRYQRLRYVQTWKSQPSSPSTGPGDGGWTIAIEAMGCLKLFCNQHVASFYKSLESLSLTKYFSNSCVPGCYALVCSRPNEHARQIWNLPWATDARAPSVLTAPRSIPLGQLVCDRPRGDRGLPLWLRAQQHMPGLTILAASPAFKPDYSAAVL